MTEINTVFDGLDTREIEYVQARANAKSDLEALRLCGFSRGWLNSHDKENLNKRALEFKTDGILRAQMKLDEALPKAVDGLVKLLDSRNENIKIKAQTEIMDRRMGRPVQKSEVTGADGNALEIVVKYVRQAEDRTDSA
jgi:hypothetical protein